MLAWVGHLLKSQDSPSTNTLLGLEAARHFARLKAQTVILAVRDLSKGSAAKASIESTTNCHHDCIQVWQLDLSSYQSVQQFAERCNSSLSRNDAVVENAGVIAKTSKTAEDNELTLTTNVVSTFLLALLLLPKLKETAQKYNIRPNLVIVSSDVHFFTTLPEKSAPQGRIFSTLNEKSTADMDKRYPVSKLLEVFAVRQIAVERPANTYPVTVNSLNPGFCHSELAREAGGWGIWAMKLLLARTTEAGSRTLVHAAGAGAETHGQYLSDCEIMMPSPFVLSQEGRVTQKRVWEELSQKLEKIRPGVMANL